MYYDLTKGKISKNLILFALPMMAGNLMQQFYNIADTLIVGRGWKECTRGGGARLYTYDLSDLDFSGTFHGGRSLIFHL